MSERGIRIFLVFASVTLTVIVATVGREAYRRAEHAKWKQEQEARDWLGMLTVASPHKGLFWEYRPYGEYRMIRTNRYGFRDADFETPEKPAGTYRYAFIGDSVTLSVGVRSEDSFVKRFEALENRSGAASGGVEALNFGIDGYDTRQVRALLEAKALQFQPDHVVYVLCANDFDFYAAAGYNALYFDPPRFFVLRDLELWIRSIFGIGYHRYMFWKNGKRVADEIGRMKSLLDERGIRFSILLVPVFWPDRADFSDYREIYINDFIREKFASDGSIVWDTLDMFRAQGKSPKAFAMDVWHLNEAGHTLVAQYLHNKVHSAE